MSDSLPLEQNTRIPMAWLAGYANPADFRAAVGVPAGQVVSAATLTDFLRCRLSPGAAPQEWLDDCRAAKRMPPLIGEVAARCGLDQKVAISTLAKNGVPMLRVMSPHGVLLRVTPLWAETRKQKRRVCSLKDVTRLFDTEKTAVDSWRRGKAVACLLGHDHPNYENHMLSICWLACLTHSAPLQTVHHVERLWAARMVGGDSSPLLGTAEAAAALGVTRSVLVRRVANGEMPVVRTPSNILRFAPEWLTL